MTSFHLDYIRRQYQRETGLEWWEDSDLYSEWLEQREEKRAVKAKKFNIQRADPVPMVAQRRDGSYGPMRIDKNTGNIYLNPISKKKSLFGMILSSLKNAISSAIEHEETIKKYSSN